MSSEIFYATGRRKTSSARVYLKKGKGNISVNDRTLNEYFGRKVAQMLVMQPLELLDLSEKIDVNVKVKGGGSFGQAGAIRHGISRALTSYDEELRPQLKKLDFLLEIPEELKERSLVWLKQEKANNSRKDNFNDIVSLIFNYK